MGLVTKHLSDLVGVAGLALAALTYLAARAKTRAMDLKVLAEQAWSAKEMAGAVDQLLQSGSYKPARHLCSVLTQSCNYMQARVSKYYGGQEADSTLRSATDRLQGLPGDIDQVIYGAPEQSKDRRDKAFADMEHVSQYLSRLAGQLSLGR